LADLVGDTLRCLTEDLQIAQSSVIGHLIGVLTLDQLFAELRGSR
jgi:hypothetical protein